MKGPNFVFDRYTLAFLRADESRMREAASTIETTQSAATMDDRHASVNTRFVRPLLSAKRIQKRPLANQVFALAL